MAKLTQAEVKERGDRWVDVNAKIVKAEAAKNAELQPFVEQFNADTEAVRNKHDKKINSLREQADQLQAEVIGWLEGVGKPITLAGEKAVASIETKVGPRVINVQKFFETVADKNAAFWDCLTVVLAKADKFLGKTQVDAISTKDSKLVATLKEKAE